MALHMKWVARGLRSFLVLGGVVVASHGSGSAGAGQPAPPNIVLIISDDQGWTDYGFMGHPHIQTPHLDRLAREGVLFPRGHVPTPLCRPSLMSLATGLYAFQHGVTGNDPARPAGATKPRPAGTAIRDPAALRKRLITKIERLPTIAKILGWHGYLSHQSGKWWEGGYRIGGFTHGMTRGFPQPGGRHGDDGLKIGRTGMGPVFEFIDHTVAAGKPFFLWYAPFMPHQPHDPPARLREKYDRLGLDPALARYYAMCEWFDETCGALLGYLDAKALRENTLIVSVCDNGWIQRTAETPVPEGWKGGFAPHSKRSVREGGVRTPILFSWPGRLRPGIRQDLVSSIDILPTVLGAAGVPAPAGLPGLNLWTNLRSGAALKGRILFGDSYAHDIADVDHPEASLLNLWCIEDEWKLILAYDGVVPESAKVFHPDTEPVQLYQVVKDPQETQNLAARYPDRVARLRQQIEQWYPLRERRLVRRSKGVKP